MSCSGQDEPLYKWCSSYDWSLQWTGGTCREVSPNCLCYHRSLHKEALAARNMPTQLSNVLQTVIQIPNLTKHRPLNSRLFMTLCKELGSHLKHLLLHTEVRWLSRVKLLGRTLDLWEECCLFLLSIDFESIPNFLMRVLFYVLHTSPTFLKDERLKKATERSKLVLTNKEKIKGFHMKLRLGKVLLKKSDISTFDNLAGLFLPEIAREI